MRYRFFSPLKTDNKLIVNIILYIVRVQTETNIPTLESQ